MKRCVLDDEKQIVYIIDEIEVPRGIRNKNKRTANEVIIFGMSYANFEKLFKRKIERREKNRKCL